MNALANSQYGELEKFIHWGFPDGQSPVRFATYTGQESQDRKQAIVANPPDILLTNYVMLELILTRPEELNLIQSAKGLHFLVLDEMHTYRGRQGSDVAMLVRRVRDRFEADRLQCVGTSATLASAGTFDEQRAEIARVASNLFGSEVRPEHVIGETLRRATPNRELADPGFRSELTRRLADFERHPPTDYRSFVADPLSIWIESIFGLGTEEGTGRLVRARPRSITGKEGAAADLFATDGRRGSPVLQCHPGGLARRLPLPQPGHGVPSLRIPDPPVCQPNPWGISFMAMLHMASDSGLFRTREQLEADGWVLDGNVFHRAGHTYLPLYEAKMVHHFDHRFGTYEGQTDSQANQGKLPELDEAQHADPHRVSSPRYWVPAEEVEGRLAGRWDRWWLLGWRDVCRNTDTRTVIASLVPGAGVGHKFPIMLPTGIAPNRIGCLYANLATYVLDYAARQKMGGTSLSYFHLKQFPILPPDSYDQEALWSPGATRLGWLLARVLELTYTAWDLSAFARDCGYEGPPFRWDEARRFVLRCEIDAAFFHLYGINRDDTAYILGTFPIVRRKDEAAHGEYRTKRIVLEIHDEMAEAIRTGVSYQTVLDPPPADPRRRIHRRDGSRFVMSSRCRKCPTSFGSRTRSSGRTTSIARDRAV